MSLSTPGLRQAVDTLTSEITRMLGTTRPVVVAIDGRSGAGKSTLASLVGKAVGATCIVCDDFFAAGIPGSGWDARTPAQRASDALEWTRLRDEAIEPLRAGRVARWHGFDFGAGPRPDGTYPVQSVPSERAPSAVILLDGAYSARPELRPLIDLAVLIEAPSLLRSQRLAAREDPRFLKAWHSRWDAAEDHYFTVVCPPSRFDLVLTTGESNQPEPD